MAFVDANVLLDVATKDVTWLAWSLARIEEADLSGPLLANEIVYAEVSVGYTKIELVEALFDGMGVELVALPHAALFLAGKAFRNYRDRRGVSMSILPDFFIGAQAMVMGQPLITRDPRRYRTYFPDLELIAP
jgi:predicted nucleic acid-binding protein